MQRRTFFSAAVSLLATPDLLHAAADASAVPSSLVEEQLVLPGDTKLARRALLLKPAKPSKAAAQRLLVLLHGLGETKSEELGLVAWSKLYGLTGAYQRLLRPPITRSLPKLRYLTDARLAEMNASLAERPFEGFYMVCPITPNP
ncbi:MAG TPA: hypothetical protein VK524_31275, partial [Polyangiaceae bacterium]|nr:hypothetical protein [Polyangiaceae bacterium]